MMLKRMSRRSWGYLEIAPDRAGGARSAWSVTLTPAGRRAQQVWEPLAGEVTTRAERQLGRAAGCRAGRERGLAFRCPLYALLAGVLVAFAAELQRASGMSPVRPAPAALWADAVPR